MVAVRCTFIDSGSLPIVSSHAFAAGGSADPNTNAALAAVLRAAKSSGVPKSNVENALKKVRKFTGARC